jgi:hypothetical protein
VSDKDYKPPDNLGETGDHLARCTVCGRLWSSAPAFRLPVCACGGRLEAVDMAKQLASLPVKAYDRDKDKK